MNTVIFDMDGLLIDSEPIWQEATAEMLTTKGLELTTEMYETTTGLRTAEFLDYWFTYFNIDKQLLKEWESWLFDLVIDKVKTKGKILNGIPEIFNFFQQRNFKIGIASSSPMQLIEVVIEKLQMQQYLHAVESAQDLEYGKPNPQVYLNCASALKSRPQECICFEDSVNGMIAAKAALMKCVVVPAPHQKYYKQWSVANLQLNSLAEFNEKMLQDLM